jgi:hypothetical protein
VAAAAESPRFWANPVYGNRYAVGVRAQVDKLTWDRWSSESGVFDCHLDMPLKGLSEVNVLVRVTIAARLLRGISVDCARKVSRLILRVCNFEVVCGLQTALIHVPVSGRNCELHVLSGVCWIPCVSCENGFCSLSRGRCLAKSGLASA